MQRGPAAKAVTERAAGVGRVLGSLHRSPMAVGLAVSL
jgi:hypothetical protein